MIAVRVRRETYLIDDVLLQMIRASPHNSRQIKSKIVNPPSPNNVPQNVNQISDDDSVHGADAAIATV